MEGVSLSYANDQGQTHYRGVSRVYAAKTSEATIQDIPELVDESILVDDSSADATVAVARRLGLTVEVHPENRGYREIRKAAAPWRSRAAPM
jgi:glycosyltransferase involved in cell wall biosynthesis